MKTEMRLLELEGYSWGQQGNKAKREKKNLQKQIKLDNATMKLQTLSHN